MMAPLYCLWKMKSFLASCFDKFRPNYSSKIVGGSLYMSAKFWCHTFLFSVSSTFYFSWTTGSFVSHLRSSSIKNIKHYCVTCCQLLTDVIFSNSSNTLSVRCFHLSFLRSLSDSFQIVFTIKSSPS